MHEAPSLSEHVPNLLGGREEYSEVDLPTAIAEYYFYELVRATLKRMEIADPDCASKMEFRAASLFNSLKKKADTIEMKTLEFIKEYLIYAVASELQFAERTVMSDAEFKTVQVAPGPLFRRGNSADIVEYFEKAEALFNMPYWDRMKNGQYLMGGPRWAKVAHVGTIVWRSHPEKAARLIDHVFDLEHNGGHIFDKDLPRVKRVNTSAQILDMKKDANSLAQQVSVFDAFMRRDTTEELQSDLKHLSYLVGQPFMRHNSAYPVLKNMVGI